jgi:spermidine/putrescine transport system ATP-binding protein
MDSSFNSSTTETAVAFSGVTKKFGAVDALKKIDISISNGQFISILGPSGCGKTTLLRLIAGFEQPTTGEVFIGGQPMGNVPPYRRPVNMVFQDYALFPNLNVFDNVAYGLRGRSPKIPPDIITQRVEQALRTVEILDKAARRVWQLSGGQKQRVALARAMVNEPKVLLLDEPMAALDKKLRRDVQFRLQTLQRQTGITFIMVTHDQHEALSLSDQIIIMRDGMVEQVGSPESLYHSPRTKFVAGFIGDFNVLPGIVESADAGTVNVSYEGQSLPIPARPDAETPEAGSKVVFGFSPNACELDSTVSKAGPGSLSLSGKVENVIFAGEKYELRVRGPRHLKNGLIARFPVADAAFLTQGAAHDICVRVNCSAMQILSN